MIQDKDAELHPAPADDPLWAETNYFGFEVPEVPLHIGLYSLFRPNLGIVNSAIFANSRRVTSGWEVDYWDHRAYLPMKADESLLGFELRNSLGSPAWNRTGSGSSLPSADLLSVGVRFEALMPPFDIHDPHMDPRADRGGSDLLRANSGAVGTST